MIHRHLRRRRRGSGPFAPPAGRFVRRFGESVPQFGEFLEERFRVLPASGLHRVGVVVSWHLGFGYRFQYAGFQQEGPPVAVISRGPFIGVVGYLFGGRFEFDGGVCDDGGDVFLPRCRFWFLARRRRPRRRDVFSAHACRFLYARRRPVGGASLVFSLYYRAAPALGTRVPSGLMAARVTASELSRIRKVKVPSGFRVMVRVSAATACLARSRAWLAS